MKWYRFKNDINFASTDEGVYLLGNYAQVVIYVGRTDNLRDRLEEHPDPDNPCLQGVGVSYFAFERTFDSKNREQEFIEYYDPECNRT